MKRKTVDGTKKRSTGNLHEHEQEHHDLENEQEHGHEVVSEEKKE